MNQQQHKTILLVEDEAITVMAIALKIKNLGYDVVTAHSGEEAVKLAAENHNINLVLMDINLGGGIDGTEAARQILAVRHLPIVFLTAHTEEEYVNKVKAITRYGYVIKHSGDFVLKSSIEMAFELFQEHEKTRASEEKYRTYINNAPEGVFIADSSGKYIDVNPAACKMTGYSREELLTLSISELDVTDENAEDILTFHDLKNTESLETERTLKRKDGTLITVLLNAVRISEDQYMAFCTDITERKKMEEELRFQSLLLNQIQDLVTATDVDGTVNYVNDAVARMFGVTKDQLIGRTIFDFGEDSSKGASQQEILDATVQQGTWRGEVVNYDTEGKEYILDCRTWIIRNRRGEPRALCSVLNGYYRKKKSGRENSGTA